MHACIQEIRPYHVIAHVVIIVVVTMKRKLCTCYAVSPVLQVENNVFFGRIFLLE